MMRVEKYYKRPKPFGKQKNCEECLYYQGLLKTLVSPCPQCTIGLKKILQETICKYQDD